MKSFLTKTMLCFLLLNHSFCIDNKSDKNIESNVKGSNADDTITSEQIGKLSFKSKINQEFLQQFKGYKRDINEEEDNSKWVSYLFYVKDSTKYLEAELDENEKEILGINTNDPFYQTKEGIKVGLNIDHLFQILNDFKILRGNSEDYLIYLPEYKMKINFNKLRFKDPEFAEEMINVNSKNKESIFKMIDARNVLITDIAISLKPLPD